MSCAAASQLEAARHPTPPPLKEALAPRLPSPGTPGISVPLGAHSPGTHLISASSHRNQRFAAVWLFGLVSFFFFCGSHAAFSTLSWGISSPKRSVF